MRSAMFMSDEMIEQLFEEFKLDQSRWSLRLPGAAAHLVPLAGRGPHGKAENQNSAR
jgi:hypothetical protein